MKCHIRQQGVSGVIGKHVVVDPWCDLGADVKLLVAVFPHHYTETVLVSPACMAVPFSQLAAVLSISVVLTKPLLMEQ